MDKQYYVYIMNGGWRDLYEELGRLLRFARNKDCHAEPALSEILQSLSLRYTQSFGSPLRMTGSKGLGVSARNDRGIASGG